MTHAWPTYAEAEAMAKLASSFGLLLRLGKTSKGYAWTWLHQESGLAFDGDTTAQTKDVALVLALQNAPMIGH